MVTRTILKQVDIYFNSGGMVNHITIRNDILEYDPETEEWTQIGTMREARYSHAVSVVDFRDYADFCRE